VNARVNLYQQHGPVADYDKQRYLKPEFYEDYRDAGLGRRGCQEYVRQVTSWTAAHAPGGR
jgi:hypothetical protein